MANIKWRKINFKWRKISKEFSEKSGTKQGCSMSPLFLFNVILKVFEQKTRKTHERKTDRKKNQSILVCNDMLVY